MGGAEGGVERKGLAGVEELDRGNCKLELHS